MIDRLCDDFGLDTIEMGCTLGVLMEGGVIPWGDGQAAIDMVKKVGTTDPWGLIIGNGSVFTGRALGVDRVPAVKSQGLPAYDPRAEKGMGLSYATSPMGGDHTSGYTVAINIVGCAGGGDPLKKEGNIERSRNLQIATAAIDATGPLPVRRLRHPGQPGRAPVRCGPDQRPLRPQPHHRLSDGPGRVRAQR